AAWAERTERGEAAFEEAIVAVASLYFYARRHSMPVQFWSGETGVVQGDRSVLEVLAGLQPQTGGTQEPLPDRPLLWLPANAQSLTTLPEGSRWVLWSAGGAVPLGARQLPGLVLAGDGPLVEQLQR
ncbi:MAG: DUF58 domain-containing protein, partial [Prochlorothrix sp.]